MAALMLTLAKGRPAGGAVPVRPGPVDVEDGPSLVDLARKATFTYLRRRPGLYSQRDDMLGDASLAAHIAHQRYDGSGTFGGYAYPRVVFAIIDGLRARGFLCRQDYAAAGEQGGGNVLASVQLDPLSLSDPYLMNFDVVDPRSEVPLRHVEGRVAAPQVLRLLDPWPREQEVIRRVDLDGEMQVAVARDLGVTESRVCQLRRVGLRRLRNYLGLSGTLAG